MTSLLAAVLFAGFVAAALLAGRARAGAPSAAQPLSSSPAPPRIPSRTMSSAFIAFSLVASFGAGLAQRNLWPFSPWPLVAGIHPAAATHARLVAVDGTGVEHGVDYRAWEPMAIDELYSWLQGPFMSLEEEQKEAAFAWLLLRAEKGRRRALAGEAPSDRSSILGPLEAPLFLLHPRIWDDAGAVPAAPFTGLRLYLESWDVEGRARGERGAERTLVHESASPRERSR